MASRMNTRRLAKRAVDHSAEPKSVFIVIKQTGSEVEEGEAPNVSVRGVHPTEEQAYSAAIVELIYDLEHAKGTLLPKVREIGKTKTLPLIDRLKSVQACQDSEERVKFVIKKSLSFPELKELDSEDFLNGSLLPSAYCDSSDEENYDPEDEDEDEDGDDDMADLVNEDEELQGIQGSGAPEENKD